MVRRVLKTLLGEKEETRKDGGDVYPGSKRGRQLTVRAISERFDLVYGTVQRILTDKLQLSKGLRRDLVDAIRKKRSGIPIENFIPQQDNASPNTAEVIQLEIGVLCFQMISLPPYSSDLAPMVFAVFPAIKKQLKGRSFRSLEELRTAKAKIVAQFNQQWYTAVFDQWLNRHCRCISCQGVYFEKLNKTPHR